MTLFEALSINKEMLHRLQEFGAKPDDCQYIDLYRDYQSMREGGGESDLYRHRAE